MIRLPHLLIFAVVPGLAVAEEPVLQNSGPVIYLADNLDEVDSLGYCLDTKDRGQTERIQLHSCKPDTDNPMDRDVLFAINPETGRIEHQEYTGFCITTDPDAAETELALVECLDTANQQFSFNPESGEIHPNGDETKCLAGAAESSAAGPFMSRTLGIVSCSEVDPSLRTFTIQQ